jgi:hypothetical protein
MISHQRPLTIIYDILTLNKLYALTYWYDSLMYKKNMYIIHVSHSLSIEICTFACWFGATSVLSDLYSH